MARVTRTARPPPGAHARRRGPVAARDLQLAAASRCRRSARPTERPRRFARRPGGSALPSPRPRPGPRRACRAAAREQLGRQRGDEVAEAVDVDHLPLHDAALLVQRRRARARRSRRCSGPTSAATRARRQAPRGRREHVAAVEGRADRIAAEQRRLDAVDPARRPRRQRQHAVVRPDEEAAARLDQDVGARRRPRRDRRPRCGSCPAGTAAPPGPARPRPPRRPCGGTPCVMSTSWAAGASDSTTPFIAPA